MKIIEQSFVIVGSAILSLLIADFISGLIHWAQDSYGTPSTPILGRFVKYSYQHHADPRDLTKKKWGRPNNISLIIILGMTVFFYYLGWFNWIIGMVIVLAINMNEFHKWLHQNHSERFKIVTILQKMNVLQNPKIHAVHHTYDNNTDYCFITNYLNPLLNFIKFWDRMELIIYKISGIKSHKIPNKKNTEEKNAPSL